MNTPAFHRIPKQGDPVFQLYDGKLRELTGWWLCPKCHRMWNRPTSSLCRGCHPLFIPKRVWWWLRVTPWRWYYRYEHWRAGWDADFAKKKGYVTVRLWHATKEQR
jgi:hypothetical protein